MSRSYVFLDFDGVLNTAEFLRTIPKTSAIMLPDAVVLPDHIDRVHVPRLNAITRSVGAEIVVSSTWRTWMNLRDLQDSLRSVGVEAPVIGTTPYLAYQPRGKEIDAWIKDSRASGCPFVILDDNEDMGLLAPWLVRTTFDTGLLDTHVEQAIRILREGT